MAAAFDSLYGQGFVRVALGIPAVRVADPAFSVEQMLGLAHLASADHAALCVFPELGVSSYSAEDLFHQDALLDAVQAALAELARRTAALACLVIVGAPLRVRDGLFNCAVVLHGGRVLGVVPKSYLPGYREFYEKRQFAVARDAAADEVLVAGQAAPFGERRRAGRK